MIELKKRTLKERIKFLLEQYSNKGLSDKDLVIQFHLIDLEEYKEEK